MLFRHLSLAIPYLLRMTVCILQRGELEYINLIILSNLGKKQSEIRLISLIFSHHCFIQNDPVCICYDNLQSFEIRSLKHRLENAIILLFGPPCVKYQNICTDLSVLKYIEYILMYSMFLF